MRKPSTQNLSRQRPIIPQDKTTALPVTVVPRTDNFYLGMVCLEQGVRTIAVLAEWLPSGSSSWQPLGVEAREGAHFELPHSVDASARSLWRFQLRRDDRPLSTSLIDVEEDVIGTDPSTTKRPLWVEYKLDSATLEPVVEFLKSEDILASSTRPFSMLKTAFASLDELRERYFEKGVRLPPSGPTLLISKDSKFCVGPVRWRRTSDNENAPFVADIDDLTAVPVIPTPDLHPPLKDIAGRTLRVISQDLKQPIAYYDFRPIATIVSEQVDRMTAVKSPEREGLAQLLTTLVTGTPPPAPNSFNDFRLRSFLARWDGASERNMELERAVLDSPTARTILDEARQKAIAHEVAKGKVAIELELVELRKQEGLIRQQIIDRNKTANEAAANELKKQKALSDLAQRYEELSTEITAMETYKAELSVQVGDLEATVAHQLTAAEGALVAEITRLKGRAAAELASLLPLRHALGLDNITINLDTNVVPPLIEVPIRSTHSRNDPPVEREQVAYLAPPFPSDIAKDVAEHEDVVAAIRALKKELRSHGGKAWESLALPTLATLLAGLVPTVAVEESGRFWQAVADSLFSGRRLSVTVPPYATRSSDLIGEMHSGTFTPHANRLADLLLSPSSALSLVVLEDVDGIDWSAVIAPLLSARKEKRLLPILHPFVADRCGVYAKLGSLTWPAHVLVAGSWRGWGVPPTPGFWQQAALLIPESDSSEPLGSGAVLSALAIDEWISAQDAAPSGGTKMSASEKGQVWEEARQLSGPVSTAVAFYLALRFLGEEHDEARRKTRAHILLPYRLAQGLTSEGSDAIRDAEIRSILFLRDA